MQLCAQVKAAHASASANLAALGEGAEDEKAVRSWWAKWMTRLFSQVNAMEESRLEKSDNPALEINRHPSGQRAMVWPGATCECASGPEQLLPGAL